MRDILIIMTGGTIDAEAYPNPARPPKKAMPLKDSLVPQAVEELGFADDCRFFQWMMKDSKDFTASELYALAVFIRQRRADYIIITHGTDHMPENSRTLARELGAAEKRVIVTGAMMPLANGRQSDGYDNLRYAIETIEQAAPGVHVVMHGRQFNPQKLRKNFTTMCFEEAE